jgi:hypothetical protein
MLPPSEKAFQNVKKLQKKWHVHLDILCARDNTNTDRAVTHSQIGPLHMVN